MKNKKLLAVISAILCGLEIMAVPNMLTTSAESTDRTQNHDSSLVLNSDIAEISMKFSNYMYTNKVAGYSALTEDNLTEVVCTNADDLEKARNFAQENNFNENLIIFTLDETYDMTMTDGEDFSPVTNEELETLVLTAKALSAFVFENEDSADTSLKWGRHSVMLFVKTQAVYDKAVSFLTENGIEPSLVDVIISPEHNYEIIIGGQKDIDEVNTIVADEYITLKTFLKENEILSNIYLTTGLDEKYPDTPYTCVEIYVKDQSDEDAIQNYMTENYFWQDVVKISVVSDFSENPENSVQNKDFIYLNGDSNDDGQFGITDVIKLQRYILAADTLYERQAYASDLNNDGNVNVYDLCLAKKKLIYNE